VPKSRDYRRRLCLRRASQSLHLHVTDSHYVVRGIRPIQLSLASAPNPSDPEPPNPVTKRSKTDVPTLLSADIAYRSGSHDIDYGMEREWFDRHLDVILYVLPSDHLRGASRGRVGSLMRRELVSRRPPAGRSPQIPAAAWMLGINPPTCV